MTLRTFLDLTQRVPDAMLRPAMVAALAVEPARTPEACRRFYDRVVQALSVAATREARPLMRLEVSIHSGPSADDQRFA